MLSVLVLSQLHIMLATFQMLKVQTLYVTACILEVPVPKSVIYNHYFAAWTMYFQIMMKERPTKYIFKVNHIFRISILLPHVSALQKGHLQGAQRILMKLCVCYVIYTITHLVLVCPDLLTSV
jgi:hypothetical protein